MRPVQHHGTGDQLFTGDELRSERKKKTKQNVPLCCTEDDDAKKKKERIKDDVKLKKWHQQVVRGGPLLTFAACA